MEVLLYGVCQHLFYQYAINRLFCQQGQRPQFWATQRQHLLTRQGWKRDRQVREPERGSPIGGSPVHRGNR